MDEYIIYVTAIVAIVGIIVASCVCMRFMVSCVRKNKKDEHEK
ncbi:hypothetical protein [Clostridium sp. JS66]|nr:hypothetical protein [Clostridium sp. JS66]WPC42372.1 hypothetical protein Q6H37_02600 [Clostridium sp. JS66]